MPIQTIDRGTAGDAGDKFKIGVALDTCQANDNYLDAKITALTLANFAAISSAIIAIGQTFQILCHTTSGYGFGDFVGVSSSGLTADGGLISTTGMAGVYAQRVNYSDVTVEMFGVYPGGVSATNTVNLKAAIAALRKNPVVIASGIGGPSITAYSSGKIIFGYGVYDFDVDQIKINFDLGLTFEGKGSRTANNSVRAPTTLRFNGNGEFCIQITSNGARGFKMRDLDVCYADNAFTGDVFDLYGSPSISCERVFFGTYGLTAPTRFQTARSIVRSTYDEFINFTNCIFDGAIDGWWADDARDANTFGGSVTTFQNCTWYDFTGNHIRHDGLRTKLEVNILNCCWNPISVSCTRCLDINNVDGLNIVGSFCAGSTTMKANTEWIRIKNCSGTINGLALNDFSKAGTISGNLFCSGWILNTTDGLTVTGGAITIKNCEIKGVGTGINIIPDIPLCFEFGPNLFGSGLTNSYSVTPDSASISGYIRYDSSLDASSGKFVNDSSRVTIRNNDEKSFTVSGAAYTALITDTGRTHNLTGGAAQIITLPTPVAGTKLKFKKLTTQNVTINYATIYTGTGATKATTTLLTTDLGAYIEFEAFATAGWTITGLVGAWTV